MRNPHWLVGFLWLAFVLLWVILGQFNKKASKSTPWWLGWRLRLAIIAGAITVISFHHHAARHHAVAARLISIDRSLPVHPGIIVQWVGVGLCVLGFGCHGSAHRLWRSVDSLSFRSA